MKEFSDESFPKGGISIKDIKIDIEDDENSADLREVCKKTY